MLNRKGTYSSLHDQLTSKHKQLCQTQLLTVANLLLNNVSVALQNFWKLFSSISFSYLKSASFIQFVTKQKVHSQMRCLLYSLKSAPYSFIQPTLCIITLYYKTICSISDLFVQKSLKKPLKHFTKVGLKKSCMDLHKNNLLKNRVVHGQNITASFDTNMNYQIVFIQVSAKRNMKRHNDQSDATTLRTVKSCIVFCGVSQFV